ncbi:hypothetical protein A5906_21390 [Bradyrhizobium sacchari]|uniref:Uncharacterized protein DUF2867 n=1 Tax=Bradyrhizobium sacchari TaxID=1399419 RepID=A0A560KE66_9BRAD|nr:DUF2867 domain-containing protein [Bradyrhizobium sacchari]OPZ00704.1 hypothetical protein A5906_21390 [Bradyrhizobium sacchari]TWB65184.1 uncharacterized protein DUF2867 [Bradyrhizobium sacchari]TWB81507.1 uncharacterized protein DUF2867 [Bradyrhizobium sacchari]
MIGTVREVTPDVDAGVVLAGAQFIDAFRVEVGATQLSAREACTRMVLHGPRWIDTLTRLRNVLVKPFGLKTSGDGAPAPYGMIGLFPVLSETPEQLIAGFDDYHLDFRVVVDIAGGAADRRVTLTTLVRTNNLLGRTYLRLIVPFHKLVARSMMGDIAEPAR